MNTNTQLIVRAATAVVILAMLLAALLINPWIAAGLAPVLIGVSAILREVSARGGNDRDPGEGSNTVTDDDADAA
ncbi:hypothetical protein [Pseudonocardia sp. ICBG162]|uniref:hypothetical protein n=1 Tax=Pseudonocardia sp. ICBG162 TaxID=2846761 RepID=UPI001CF69FA7|nr:hypothetical protein [Pseudonocardia sp. ICBG162]